MAAPTDAISTAIAFRSATSVSHMSGGAGPRHGGGAGLGHGRRRHAGRAYRRVSGGSRTPHAEKAREKRGRRAIKVLMTRRVPAAALALLLAACGDVWAGPPTETLRDAFAAVNYLLQDLQLQENSDERLAEIRGVVGDHFDLREAARLALGREWETRTPAERDEFVQLYADLLRHAYFSGIASRARVQGGLVVNYRDETIEGDRAAVVTTVVGRDGGEIPVEYRMRKDGDRWLVYDVVIAGVSLATNYRGQFARGIPSSSYPELVAQVRAKTAEVPGVPVAAEPAVQAAGPPAPVPRLEVEREPAPAAPEPPASPPPAPPARVVTSSYWIQVGAFRNAETAVRLATRLLLQDLPLSLDAVALPAGQPGTLALVLRGPVRDEAGAAATRRSLRTPGAHPFIARESD